MLGFGRIVSLFCAAICCSKASSPLRIFSLTWAHKAMPKMQAMMASKRTPRLSMATSYVSSEGDSVRIRNKHQMESERETQTSLKENLSLDSR